MADGAATPVTIATGHRTEPVLGAVLGSLLLVIGALGTVQFLDTRGSDLALSVAFTVVGAAIAWWGLRHGVIAVELGTDVVVERHLLGATERPLEPAVGVHVAVTGEPVPRLRLWRSRHHLRWIDEHGRATLIELPADRRAVVPAFDRARAEAGVEEARRRYPTAARVNEHHVVGDGGVTSWTGDDPTEIRLLLPSPIGDRLVVRLRSPSVAHLGMHRLLVTTHDRHVVWLDLSSSSVRHVDLTTSGPLRPTVFAQHVETGDHDDIERLRVDRLANSAVAGWPTSCVEHAADRSLELAIRSARLLADAPDTDRNWWNLLNAGALHVIHDALLDVDDPPPLLAAVVDLIVTGDAPCPGSGEPATTRSPDGRPSCRWCGDAGSSDPVASHDRHVGDLECSGSLRAPSGRQADGTWSGTCQVCGADVALSAIGSVLRHQTRA